MEGTSYFKKVDGAKIQEYIDKVVKKHSQKGGNKKILHDIEINVTVKPLDKPPKGINWKGFEDREELKVG